jgi:hypothetical protein
LRETGPRMKGLKSMKFTTKGVPTAGLQRRSDWHQESTDTDLMAHDSEQAMPDEHDRVLAIVAMGGNDVPPALVRRAIDERWSVDKAARAFQKLELHPV